MEPNNLIQLPWLTDSNYLKLKAHIDKGKPLFLEVTGTSRFQNIYEAKNLIVEKKTINGYTRFVLNYDDLELYQNGELTRNYHQIADLAWNVKATSCKKVKTSEQVAPTFMDKLGQVVEKGDLVVSSNRDGSLEIGQLTRVTPKGTVFLKNVATGKEFKLYQMARSGHKNTGLLKLTRDLRDQIMLLKLSA